MHDMCNGEKKKKKKNQHIETINFSPNPRCDQLVSGPISISDHRSKSFIFDNLGPGKIVVVKACLRLLNKVHVFILKKKKKTTPVIA